jgi:hypothetical protein
MGWSSNRPTDYFAVGMQPAINEEATTFQFPKHLSGTGFEQVPDVGEEREGGGGQEVALAYKKLIKADGNAIYNLRGVGAVYALIDGALGNTATIAGTIPTVAAGAFTSGFPTGSQRIRMVPAATLPNLTVEQRYSDEVERVTNAKVNQLTLEGGAGLPIKISGAFAGGGTVFQRDIASALTPVYSSGDPIYFPRGSYVFTGQSASGGKITKWKVTAMRHLDEGVQTTDLWRDELVELQADYSFDCTLKYEDRLLYQGIAFGGGSVVPIPIPTLSVMLHSNNGQASGATAYRSVTIGMANLLGKSAKVNKLEPDGKTVYIDLACTSIKPAGATDSLVIDLVVASSAWTNFP